MSDFGVALHSADPRARARAAAMLGQPGRWPKGTAAALTDLASTDPAPAVRRAALRSLLRRARPERATAGWATACGDADAGVRRAAADAAVGFVERLRDTAAAPAITIVARALIGLLDDPAPLVAEAGAFALGEIVAGGTDPTEPTDPNGAEIASNAITTLVRHARGHSDPLVREACVAALGTLRAAAVEGSERALPVVVGAASDKPAIRRRAVIALSAFDGPEAEQAIRDARTDRDWQVRQLAEDL